MTASLTLAIAAGGWIWHLSALAAAVPAIEQRVTTLENDKSDSEHRLQAMSERLSRMEPMLEFLVDQFKAGHR